MPLIMMLGFELPTLPSPQSLVSLCNSMSWGRSRRISEVHRKLDTGDSCAGRYIVGDIERDQSATGRIHAIGAGKDSCSAAVGVIRIILKDRIVFARRQ